MPKSLQLKPPNSGVMRLKTPEFLPQAISTIKNMKTLSSRKKSAIDNNACLQFLKNRGGRAKLSELTFTFSRDMIQALITQNIAKVKNTGTGFYLELEKKQ